MKGQMLGSRSLEDDISLAHSVYASSLQSEVSGRKCNAAAHPHTHPSKMHSQLMSFVLLVVGTGSVLTSSVARSGPLASLGFNFFAQSSENLS